MVAPLIAAGLSALAQKLFSNGLNTLGQAVMTKGKEVIEEKLGVDIEAMVETDEGRQQLRQMEIDNEQFLVTAALDSKKIDIENTKSARDMNATIQTSADALMFVKLLPYLLDAAIVGGTILTGLALFFFKIPAENKELAYTMFGGLLAHCGSIINFHRGTSSSSRGKDSVIASLSKEHQS